MRTRLASGPSEFLDLAGPLLLADEARHNLLLGIAGALRDHPALYPEHRLWLVEEDGRVVGAALRTPPRGLVLARPASDAALLALVQAIADDLPAVVGAVPEVDLFTRLWCARTGSSVGRRLDQGVYALTHVRPVLEAQGVRRDATPADRALAVEWWRAFAVEAMGEREPPEAELVEAVDHRLREDGWGLALWDDGGPVSLAGYGGKTPNGIRIGPVYTPPALRGRGYATALVADLSAEQLARGHRFCFLYTDLANPTSNAIYQRIGYELVCESAEIALGPAE